MDSRKAGLIGAIAGFATMGAAQAAIHPAQNGTGAMPAASYSELLQPIPNATEMLQASNAALLAQAQARIIQVQYDNDGPPGYDHHHHHHHYVPPPPVYHHHHHHHHSGVTVVVPVPGIRIGG